MLALLPLSLVGDVVAAVVVGFEVTAGLVAAVNVAVVVAVVDSPYAKEASRGLLKLQKPVGVPSNV